MPASTWMTAAGVVGAVVIGGAAVVAAATTEPSAEPTATAVASPTASASPSSTASPSALPMATSAGAPGESTISAERAVEIAASQLATVADLVVEEIDLKPEDGRMIWDVEFAGDHEVEIDAVTGAVLKLETGDRERIDDDLGADDRGGGGGDEHGDDHGGGDGEPGGSNQGHG
jgi:uncharacterized membrane protein YkoI